MRVNAPHYIQNVLQSIPARPSNATPESAGETQTTPERVHTTTFVRGLIYTETPGIIILSNDNTISRFVCTYPFTWSVGRALAVLTWVLVISSSLVIALGT